MGELFKGLTEEEKKAAQNWRHEEKAKKEQEALRFAQDGGLSEPRHHSNVAACIHCGALLTDRVPSGYQGALCSTCE